VVLDPPKFARAKSGVEEALRGYRRLLSLAVRLVEPGGYVVMCCCSGRVTSEQIEELMRAERRLISGGNISVDRTSRSGGRVTRFP
jgi:23S rRNA (cytosine1962-C5)-methyltransferase